MCKYVWMAYFTSDKFRSFPSASKISAIFSEFLWVSYSILLYPLSFSFCDRTAVFYLQVAHDVYKRGTMPFQIWLTRPELVASITCTWVGLPNSDTTISGCSDELNSFQWIIRTPFLSLALLQNAYWIYALSFYLTTFNPRSFSS